MTPLIRLGAISEPRRCTCCGKAAKYLLYIGTNRYYALTALCEKCLARLRKEVSK